MKTNEELMQLIDSAEKLALRSCTSECVINFEYMARPECTCGTRDNNADLEALFAKIRDGMRLVPEALQPSGDVVSVARGDELRAALEKIRRMPAMPFPDAGAHSWEVFGKAVFGAWCDIQRTAQSALSSTISDGKEV